VDRVEQPDVIGVDAPERRPGLPIPLVVGAVSLLVGFGLGAVASEDRSPDDVRDVEVEVPEPDPLKQADGGLVYVCDGHARAFLFAQGLPPGRTEVQLPLRGDGVLLPVLTDGAEVLTGTPDGHQYFVPRDGYLVVVQQMGVPDDALVSALVGDRRFTLAVRACGGGVR
jgi:hypothetical protein